MNITLRRRTTNNRPEQLLERADQVLARARLAYQDARDAANMEARRLEDFNNALSEQITRNSERRTELVMLAAVAERFQAA